jgi:Orsellinic acid/F9775 biosynthesis cluster protein D
VAARSERGVRSHVPSDPFKNVSNPPDSMDLTPPGLAPAHPEKGANAVAPSNPSDDTPNPPTPMDVDPTRVLSDLDDSFLRRFDLSIEHQLRIVYCLQCEEAIKPSFLRGHILTHLPSCPPLSRFTAILDSNGIDGTVHIPASPIAPIPGLKHIKGFRCTTCGSLAASDRSMRTHHQSNHPRLLYNAPEETTVHKIYEFRNATVLVETDASLAQVMCGSAYDAYKATVPTPNPSKKEQFQAPKDPKKLDGLLYATKWHEDISGCDIAPLRSLAEYPRDGDELSFLGQAVEGYLGLVLEKLTLIPTLVLRLVNTPFSWVFLFFIYFHFNLTHCHFLRHGTPANQPFRRPQTPDYVKRVVVISTCYLAFILRSSASQFEKFPVPISEEQGRACRELQEAATSGLDLLQPLHRLCWALLTTNPPQMMTNDRLCPIRRFLVVHFLRENGIFAPVQHMTTDFSKLLVFFRCIACYHMLCHGPSHDTKYFG